MEETLVKKNNASLEGLTEEDLFILPSSLHEIIVLKERDGMVPTDLLELVKQVNATEVRPDDKLTDSVYKFDAEGLKKVA